MLQVLDRWHRRESRVDRRDVGGMRITKYLIRLVPSSVSRRKPLAICSVTLNWRADLYSIDEDVSRLAVTSVSSCSLIATVCCISPTRYHFILFIFNVRTHYIVRPRLYKSSNRHSQFSFVWCERSMKTPAVVAEPYLFATNTLF